MSVFIGYPSFMAYQMMKGKKGNNDDFPSITGMIARYSASGLTNEQMAANPVWVDKTGNGHDLQLKNFAWKGMSGVGGYVADIDEWGTNSTAAYFERNSIKITATFKENVSLGLLYHNIKLRQSCVLKVTGIPEGCDAFLDDRLGNRFYMSEDGVYEIIPSNFLAEALYFSIEKYPERWYGSKLTIEQLPLYPGALVFDGVVDYGVCDNFPILTKKKGYTVVALRQWISNKTPSTFIHKGTLSSEGAFIFEFIRSTGEENVSSFGKATNTDISNYQTSNSYNGVSITPGNKEDGNVFRIGKGVYANYTNVALWELIILDHDATEEELTKIKDYFVKTYPWLFPNQAWTVVGKTNEDEDRATIANITGNGNDLVLSNFAFSGNSGYGEYAYNFNDTSWISIPDYGVISDKTSKSFNIKSFVLADYPVLYTAVNKDSSIKKVKIKVTNSIPGFYFGNKPANQIIDLSTDGIYEIPSYNSPNDVTQYGFRCSNVNDSCNITIEQIPEYEGYLVTDGVDDEVRSAAFTLNEDWTIVGNWEFITNENKNAGLTKVYAFYLYNRDYGIFVYEYLNAGQGFSVEDVKSLKAICSDGRIYLNDWQEIRNNIEQEATISKGVMAIGYFNRDFTKMAFKNLGIYNNQILSKDDCIKAYKYLQTLKAK